MKTNKVKKILITVDYDPTAQKVAEVGYSFAKNIGADVILFHVIADGTYYSLFEYSAIAGSLGFSADDLSHIMEPDGLKKATKHFLEKIKNLLDDELIHTLVDEGDFSDTIIKVAKELQIDIIVMGSHSHRWMEEILMGSVTEKVLRHTTIPLFIVPTKQKK